MPNELDRPSSLPTTAYSLCVRHHVLDYYALQARRPERGPRKADEDRELRFGNVATWVMILKPRSPFSEDARGLRL